MKRVLLVLVTAAMPLLGQETTKSDTDKAMEYYVEQAKPVAEHKRLMELTGPWKVTAKLWFSPEGEPQTSSGTGNGKMILGGRFLQFDSDTTGAFAAQSMTIYGFDRRTNEYTMVGYDTLGTYYITAAGKYDAAAKEVVFSGSYKQPPANEETRYRFHWTTPSEREHLLTLYFVMGGKDVRVAETRFFRD